MALLLLLVALAMGPQLWIPWFLIYFIPFVVALLVSTLIAPYKYAAFLQLWDYLIAGIFSVGLFALLHRHKTELRSLPSLVFIIVGAGILITIVYSDLSHLGRMNGSFVNANEFASFILLLLVIGVFQYEQESERSRKIGTACLLVVLGAVMALAASRMILLASVLFFAAYMWRRKPGHFIQITTGLVLALSAGALIYRFQNFPDPFQYYRFKIWQHSLTGILQNAYLGIGLNMLPYRAHQFIFPVDTDVGRYGRIAVSADNQYFQILAETGFLGFLTFLVAWTSLFFAFRQIPPRFLPFRYAFIIVAFISLFSVPLNNTAILFFFVFLLILPRAVAENSSTKNFSLNLPVRIVMSAVAILSFVFFVFFPYVADWQFRAAARSSDPMTADAHLQKALHYNPYQPYYTFAFLKRIVDAEPKIPPARWEALIASLDRSIQLNPIDSDFYVYKAKILRILGDSTGQQAYNSQAISAYLLAIYHSPYNVFLRIEFAYFASRTGRLEEAEAQLVKILEMEPAYLNARLLLAEVKYKMQDAPGSRMEFARAESDEKRYRAYRPIFNPKYIERLLHVNPTYKEEVKKLIFDAKKS